MASETIADIVAEMRGMGNYQQYSGDHARQLADRIEAAAKRDAAIHAMTCEANERLREHLEIALENDKRTVGNAAAMREALVKCADIINNFGLAEAVNTAMEVICDIEGVINAALAKPPRNCDLPEVAEWQPTGMAKQAWRVFKRSHKDSHLDVYGLLRCINWLLAPAKKGGEK